ncbi:hypothetical protein OE88DRAFT_357077 [Heliocybe sulcata]|uniref:DUF6533 domain-containing protein n=1 Tax=Heliocybe sulcata TaxID=5364 RepID=A0A5C3MX34_9AGAM|nr:hypothetical protein OE88DRAFT_357077 [Heliocybe sulcata]
MQRLQDVSNGRLLYRAPAYTLPCLLIVFDNSLITKFNAVASATWLVWDLFITLDDEVELIWKSRTSLPKYLYFVSRYVGIFMQALLASGALLMYCAPWLIFEAVSSTILVVAVELSMILRVQALYAGSRVVLFALLALLVGEVASFAVVAAFGYGQALPGLIPIPAGAPLPGCVMTRSTKFFQTSWVPTLAFESILFILTSYKCLRGRYGDKTPLHVKFFKDGTVYFALMFGSGLSYVIASSKADGTRLVVLFFYTIAGGIPATKTVTGALVRWMVSAISYSGTHLLLSLRRSVAQRNDDRVADLAVDAGLAKSVSTMSESFSLSPVSETWSDVPKVDFRRGLSELPGGERYVGREIEVVVDAPEEGCEMALGDVRSLSARRSGRNSDAEGISTQDESCILSVSEYGVTPSQLELGRSREPLEPVREDADIANSRPRSPLWIYRPVRRLCQRRRGSLCEEGAGRAVVLDDWDMRR